MVLVLAVGAFAAAGDDAAGLEATAGFEEFVAGAVLVLLVAVEDELVPGAVLTAVGELIVLGALGLGAGAAGAVEFLMGVEEINPVPLGLGKSGILS